MKGKMIAVALILLAGIMVGCRNLTTDDPYVDEIERVMREVQAYYFYDGSSSGSNDNIPDFPGDKGEFPGECTDFAAEFSVRYLVGDSYIIFSMTEYILWTTLRETYEDGTFNILPAGNTRVSERKPGGIVEHDGNTKDHDFIIMQVEDEWTLEASYKDRSSHAWNVAVTPDNRWFLIDATNEKQPILKEINAPAWAK